MDDILARLYDKDTSEGFKALTEAERFSDETGALYQYSRVFAEMVKSEKYVLRVRGFRLLCKQARWDTDRSLDESLEDSLCILNDEKPTAVRQALAALREVILYKPELRETVLRAANGIDIMRYKDSMQGLLAADIKRLSEL